MPTLINIHGPIASGKSTTCDALRKKLKDFAFVDHAYIKRMLSPIGRTNAKKIFGEATIFILKELMKLRKDILVQERNPIKLKKRLKTFLKGYHVHSFYLSCSLNEALRRDKSREKRPSPAKKIKENHQMSKPTKHDVIIDTEKYPLEKITNIILKQIKS
ncbi:MAG: AAA family ATPase [Nanoarchaeota archaeon]|nr:AAA family ATPase [Nanoarchaeota archaeon]MBU0978055.1 AAA family ATPase [Nanoarchaeota archaeon]